MNKTCVKKDDTSSMAGLDELEHQSCDSPPGIIADAVDKEEMTASKILPQATTLSHVTLFQEMIKDALTAEEESEIRLSQSPDIFEKAAEVEEQTSANEEMEEQTLVTEEKEEQTSVTEDKETMSDHDTPEPAFNPVDEPAFDPVDEPVEVVEYKDYKI